MTNFGLIYRVTNATNGKIYIGLTTRKLKERWGQHVRDALKSGSRLALHSAIRKYGASSFAIDIVEYHATMADLQIAERFWISTLKAEQPAGYNLTSGGEGLFGRKMSENEKARRRLIVRRRHSEETKRRIGLAHIGMKRPRGSVERGAEKRRGTKQSEKSIATASRPVLADGIEYTSLKNAALELKVSPGTISRRISLGVPGYVSLGKTRPRAKWTKQRVENGRLQCARPVRAANVDYPSITMAALALGVTRPAVSYRIKVGHSGYARL